MNPVLGIGLRVLSLAFLVAQLAIGKALLDRYPLGEVLFTRNIFGLIPVFAWVGWRGELYAVFQTKRLGSHFVRAFAGLGGMGLGFAAVKYLPIADATAINYVQPMAVVVLAAILLGERVEPYRWAAMAVGFAGVLVIVAGYAVPTSGPERSLFGAGLQLAGAAIGAYAVIETRKLVRTESPATIVIYFFLNIAFLMLLTLPFGWSVPTSADAAAMIAMGALGGIGQVLMTASFRHADASVLAPFDYTSMVWALLIGLVVFGSLPTPTMLAGTAIVVGAGLWVIGRERALKRKRSAGQGTSPPPPVV